MTSALISRKQTQSNQVYSLYTTLDPMCEKHVLLLYPLFTSYGSHFTSFESELGKVYNINEKTINYSF